MPIFAPVNAGITIQGVDFARPVSLAIIVGLVLGKPIGVFGFSWIAVRSDLALLAPGLSWPFILAGSFLTGIGFTMSLFIAGLAFDRSSLNAAKLGILGGSALSAILGIALLIWLTLRRRWRKYIAGALRDLVHVPLFSIVDVAADQFWDAMLPYIAATADDAAQGAATARKEGNTNWNDTGTGMGLGWLCGLLILVLVVLAIEAPIKYLRK